MHHKHMICWYVPMVLVELLVHVVDLVIHSKGHQFPPSNSMTSVAHSAKLNFTAHTSSSSIQIRCLATAESQTWNNLVDPNMFEISLVVSTALKNVKASWDMYEKIRSNNDGHEFWIISDIYFGIVSGMYSGIYVGILSGIISALHGKHHSLLTNHIPVSPVTSEIVRLAPHSCNFVFNEKGYLRTSRHKMETWHIVHMDRQTVQTICVWTEQHPLRYEPTICE